MKRAEIQPGMVLWHSGEWDFQNHKVEVLALDLMLGNRHTAEEQSFQTEEFGTVVARVRPRETYEAKNDVLVVGLYKPWASRLGRDTAPLVKVVPLRMLIGPWVKIHAENEELRREHRAKVEAEKAERERNRERYAAIRRDAFAAGIELPEDDAGGKRVRVPLDDLGHLAMLARKATR